jgi:large subunit ribosomal protein L24
MRTKPVTKIRIKKGDTVIVRSGKYKGHTGKVLATHPADNTITVEGINVVKKHQKPTKQNPQGGIIEITKPIWVSKVGIFEPTEKKASRIAYKYDKSGKKIRVFASNKKEVKDD